MAARGKGCSQGAVSWGLVVLAVIIASCATPVKGVSCQDAILKLLPCQGYLLGYETISIPCCMGASSLRDIAASEPDRRTICDCFKVAGQAMGISPDRAKGLPQQCNLDINFPIDASVDCTRV